ncbi:PH domain-containing protein [uncultured Enterococcus sp.]|uniref:PH domain-containing protein n=1 Tax=uncultured Enterococcus sp. TaxID=167972 RepID=UPI002AA81F04|nr:PH domain-containing protein [uncultured Enterococcus sp.]
MGLFSGMIGNASAHSTEKVEDKLKDFLAPGERVELAYKLVRDMVVFTDMRLILIDKQGVTGKKTEYKCIPYRSISRFSVETSGHFDLDSELNIWVGSSADPAEVLQFGKDKNILEVQRALATAVLR